MPITKSAKKALRVSRRRRAVNLRVKRAYKEAVREVRRIASTEALKKSETLKKKKKPATAETLKRTEALKKALTKAYSELDKAAKKGAIHKNKAARLKSRLTKLTQKRQ